MVPDLSSIRRMHKAIKWNEEEHLGGVAMEVKVIKRERECVCVCVCVM